MQNSIKKITWITINEWYIEIDILIIESLKKHYFYETEIISNNSNLSLIYNNKWHRCVDVGKQDIHSAYTLDYYIAKYWFQNPERTLWQRELTVMWINKEYLEKSSLEYFIFFEKYFWNSESETLVHNWDHYFHLIAEKVARYYDKRIIYHNSIWILSWEEIVFTDSWTYDDFNNEKYLDENIWEEDKKKSTKFIRNKIEHKPVIWWKRKFYWWFYFKKFIFYAINYITIWKYKKDYVFPFSFIKDRFFIYRNIYLNKINYDPIDKIDDKTLFFPMHVPDDAQITTRAYNFANHYETIEKILNILPSWYKLAIKEHPHWVWIINMKPFDLIRTKYRSLIILSPKENAYEILNKCYRLITINSDVWYESILIWKKPITLWNSFYSWYWYNDHIDLEDKNSIQNILNKDFSITFENRVKFINSLEKVHKKWAFFLNSKLEFNLKEENINLLTLHINNIIKWTI